MICTLCHATWPSVNEQSCKATKAAPVVDKKHLALQEQPATAPQAEFVPERHVQAAMTVLLRSEEDCACGWDRCWSLATVNSVQRHSGTMTVTWSVHDCHHAHRPGPNPFQPLPGHYE